MKNKSFCAINKLKASNIIIRVHITYTIYIYIYTNKPTYLHMRTNCEYN